MIDQAFFGRFGCSSWWRDSYEGLSPSEILAILPHKCPSNQLRKALVQRSSNKGSKRRESGDELRIHDSRQTGLEAGSVERYDRGSSEADRQGVPETDNGSASGGEAVERS